MRKVKAVAFAVGLTLGVGFATGRAVAPAEARALIADAGTTGGVLYQLAYPMLLPGPPEDGDTAPN
jgi:hypothetical protein